MAAMPWSLGHPGFASDIREVCPTRKLVISKLPKKLVKNQFSTTSVELRFGGYLSFL
jgi:hypothetical protein